MPRAVFLAAGAIWLVAGLAGVAASVAGIQVLEAVLPPLTIAHDALARTVAALGIGALLVGSVHAAVAWGLAGRGTWAPSAGILLAGVSTAGFGALGVAAATAGTAGSLAPTPAVIGLLGALLAAAGYAGAGVALVRRLRARPPI